MTPVLTKVETMACEVNARDHRERGNHPQPPRPEPSCPSLGATQSSSERSGLGRAVSLLRLGEPCVYQLRDHDRDVELPKRRFESG